MHLQLIGAALANVGSSLVLLIFQTTVTLRKKLISNTLFKPNHLVLKQFCPYIISVLKIGSFIVLENIVYDSFLILAGRLGKVSQLAAHSVLLNITTVFY
jgi:Na+-driven multidrug efflux pump